MSCWQHSSKRRVGSLRKYLVVVCWFPFKGHRTADVCAGRYSLKSDKPDKPNTIKTFSYSSVFQATLVLFTRVRTGVLLWRDNLVYIVFTWLLSFVINFDIWCQLSVAFFHVLCSRIHVSAICTIKKVYTFTCNISGFCGHVVEAFALLGCFAA
jgi:hypothetical protein